MPQIINTNIASLNAQRNLNASQGEANTALERLSSGLRINSAKDDAAGLAISTRFESQITGLNMAQRNANDGISLAQTAEGALDEVTKNLQRIRELAVQSANATNSLSDRQALNQEVQQRIAEIDRIAAQTSFNGLKVLDGTLGEQTFQVGANSGETIGVSGLDAKGNMLGGVLAQTNGFANFPVSETEAVSDVNGLDFGTSDVAFEGTINGEPISVTAAGFADAGELADALNTQLSSNSEFDGIRVEADGTDIIWSNGTAGALDVEGAFYDATAQTAVTGTDIDDLANGVSSEVGVDTTTLNNLGAGVEITFDLDDNNGTTASATITVGPGANTPEDIAQAIQDQLPTGFEDLSVEAINDDFVFTNNATDGTEFDIANFSLTEQGNAVNAPGAIEEGSTIASRFASGNVDDALNFDVEVNGTAINVEEATSLNDIIAQINAQSGETGVKANLNSDNDDIIFSSQFDEPFEVSITSPQILDDATPAAPVQLVDIETDEDNVVTMRQIDISTRDGSEEALVAVDYAFDKINGFRAELGAIQNRFESTIANLATTSENLSASNSRIRDADFAAETAELARTQVLQQAGLSVLSQANARPQQVLQLLQG
ncbi:flagellin N-terminal helical domain-containing protein [Marinobacter sp. OP 3.4]|uniref:flagellin N-terminal helical domain-containing protein n=1 Tax=Marinobacter sp. OP 3.4 TaxID=3076501 RepID=UPI002E1CEB5E